MDATLFVLDQLKTGLEYEDADAGLVALEKHGDLMPAVTLESIARNKVALKSPLTTPVGGGFTSINVSLRRHFDLYANVRPAHTFPNTKSRFDNVDLITVRENTEGAYLAEGQEVSADGETAFSGTRITRKAPSASCATPSSWPRAPAARRSPPCTRPTSSSRPRACS